MYLGTSVGELTKVRTEGWIDRREDVSGPTEAVWRQDRRRVRMRGAELSHKCMALPTANLDGGHPT